MKAVTYFRSTHRIATLAGLFLFAFFNMSRGVTLTWDANTESGIAGYKVYYGQSSRNYGSTMDVGNVTQWTISGLGAGVTYYFAVTAYSTQGLESDFSNEIQHTPSGTNQPPSISTVPPQSISEDGSTATLPVTVGDLETPATNLVLSAASSNPSLVPNGNILLGGSGSNRTVRVTPSANQFGTATINLAVSDGSSSATNSFVVTVNTVNDPPTISNIPNQMANEDSVLGPLPFIVGDVETAAGSLVVSRNSSNPALVPISNVTFGGSGSNRTVTVTPLANQSGTVTITITVNDSSLSASDAFVLTVNPMNDPPTLDPIAPLTLAENFGSQVINLSGISSGATNETQTLSVTASSSNPGLIPAPVINYISPSATGSLGLTSISNVSGAAIITVKVNDGQTTNNMVTRTFAVTVNPVNNAPMISTIPDQTTLMGVTLGPLQFTVTDTETAASNLTLSATSSNPALVPVSNIVFGGSGTNRTILIIPAAGVTGAGTITVTVNDGSINSSESFLLTVNAAAPQAISFTNNAGIVIRDSGSAAPYPSTIPVTGLSGTIVSVNVGLEGLSHSWPDDIDILLVGPNGQKITLLSDVGGNMAISNVNLRLSDDALLAVPDQLQILSGTFKPTNIGSKDTFPSPAPARPYSATLSVFNGLQANGNWTLYVQDDGRRDGGSLRAWGLTFTMDPTGSSGTSTNILPAEAMAEVVVKALQIDANGCATLQIEGLASQKYVIEVSGDLRTWTTIGIVNSETGLSLLLDCEAQAAVQRFYRVVEDHDLF